MCAYQKALCDAALAKRAVSEAITTEAESSLVEKLAKIAASLYRKTDRLDESLLAVKNYADIHEQADCYKNQILPAMQELRAVADELESLAGEEYWPYPTYGKLLFSV